MPRNPETKWQECLKQDTESHLSLWRLSKRLQFSFLGRDPQTGAKIPHGQSYPGLL